MIERKDFYDDVSFAIYNGDRIKKALKRLPINLWKIAYRKFDYLNGAKQLKHLKIPPNNKLEPLKGKRQGQYSIRINDQYRICFQWNKDHPTRIEVIDYHP